MSAASDAMKARAENFAVGVVRSAKRSPIQSQRWNNPAWKIGRWKMEDWRIVGRF